MNFDQARFNMVEQQIRTWHVLEPRLLEVMLQIPREIFTPDQFQHAAYSDTQIPLSEHALMLTPCIQARLIADLELMGGEKVLEVGAGSGYMTAVLANMAKRVISFECDAQLAIWAKNNLPKACIGNAEVRVGDGLLGSPSEGPFDAIILGGSVPEIPQALLDQLQINGRLIAVVGDEPMMQACRVTRRGAESFQYETRWDTFISRLNGIREPSHFVF
jgi:protein-L-isoaspartate(D-aspartate) O-methyltransferase